MKELEKILSDPQQQDAEGGYSADQIREAYEVGLNSDKWISVEDGLPQQNGTVLGWIRQHSFSDRAYISTSS